MHDVATSTLPGRAASFQGDSAPRPGLPRVILVGCLLIAVVSALTATPGVAAGSPGSWGIQKSYESPVNPLNAVSCVSTHCTAVGQNAIVTSTDGGSSWTSQRLPPGTRFLSGVSCYSTTSCVAVGAPVILTSTDGGASWDQRTGPANAGLVAVSCPSATLCLAVGRSVAGGPSVATSTDGGTTWSGVRDPGVASDYGLSAVSCSSNTNCAAVGTSAGGASLILSTSNGGVTWMRAVLPGVQALTGVSCSSASDCVAVGSFTTIVTTTDGGATWQITLAIPGNSSLQGVSCASSLCVVVGPGTIYTSTDHGLTWPNQVPTYSDYSLNGSSCTSSSACVTVGAHVPVSGIAETTGDAGSNWSVQSMPPGSWDFSAISCPSALVCVATSTVTPEQTVTSTAVGGDGVVFTTDGGVTWQDAAVEPDFGSFAGISCSSTTDCVAVGSNMVAKTTDGGRTWSWKGLAYAFNSVSCTSTQNCVAVAGATESTFAINTEATVFTTTDGGTTWTQEPVPSNLSTINSVSCPTASNCVAVGTGSLYPSSGSAGVIIASHDGGRTWSIEPIAPGAYPLNAVSCGLATACVASGLSGETFVTTNGGQTWIQSTVPGVASIASLSCPNSSNCVAVGTDSLGNGAAIATSTNGGSTWADQTVPLTVTALSGVACPTISGCITVGTNDQNGGVILSAGLGTRPPPPVPHLLQSASATESSPAASLQANFPHLTTGGDLLVVSASQDAESGNPITSVTDSAGDTWTLVANYGLRGHRSNGAMWYAANARAVSSVVVHSRRASSITFGVQEFSGIATANPLVSSNGNASRGTAASSGPAASQAANELAVGFIAGHGNAQPIAIGTPGFTVQSQVVTTGKVATVVTGDQIMVGAGPQAFAATFRRSMYWVAGVTIFRAAT